MTIQQHLTYKQKDHTRKEASIKNKKKLVSEWRRENIYNNINIKASLNLIGEDS